VWRFSVHHDTGSPRLRQPLLLSYLRKFVNVQYRIVFDLRIFQIFGSSPIDNLSDAGYSHSQMVSKSSGDATGPLVAATIGSVER